MTQKSWILFFAVIVISGSLIYRSGHYQGKPLLQWVADYITIKGQYEALLNQQAQRQSCLNKVNKDLKPVLDELKANPNQVKSNDLTLVALTAWAMKDRCLELYP